ncbi:class I SAM-dependent methyltransferase [Streptomyces poonensis]|uniref:Ubiquinone/menaquinone biosynthesis methyltransferase n=1 Tax=Streptomyces poonensis TaxID=68255 RepID=A0A918PXF1_9ACTN|nr:methyltransferase domain-containing protein [Streptomyces poonensis]GGZ25105.1 ubiquinone/menaquinone biosynthesis methyltransferase [Streptomyces poonensis]GLJ93608.1 ubiquinone/menaquinone biosynthesis methyltransferase [Streptomyces poonensis]
MTDETGFQLKGSAPERYEQYVAPIMAPFIEAVLDIVDLFPGAQVLDLACGTGFVARAAAARVGPPGHVCAVDVNEGMLRVAAARAPRWYPDIEFTQAPADALPFEEATFDVVICQQGAQFFPDLDAALKEAARVLRPGGRIALTTWAPKERSPYFDAQYRVIEEYGSPDDTAAFRRAFSCTADRLAAAFVASGLRDGTVHLVTRHVVTPPLTDWVPGLMASVPWTRSLTEAGPDLMARASRALCDLLVNHKAPDGTATLPFTTLLATATR